MNIENWEEKEKKKRNERIKKKSKELLLKSKLPPRLEQHKKEKEEKQLKEEKIKKQKLKEEKSEIVNKKNNKLPNYEKLQKNFEKKIQDQKNKAPKTIIEPFDFHEPVKKKNNDNYIENGGFNFRQNALEMIKNLKKNKNYNEPSLNNALNKLLQANRKLNEKK